MQFEIVTDSSCNLSDAMIREFGLHILPLTFMSDGEQYQSYTAGRDSDLKSFFKMMRDGKVFTTSLPNLQQSEDTFESILSQGKDLLYIGFSSGLSGTYQASAALLEELKKRYPERKIFHTDTLAAAMGEGLLVYKAVKLAQEGASIEDVYAWVEENKLRLHHWFFSTDLTFYIKGGRVSKLSGAIGGVLGICPLLNVSNEGKLIPRAKIRPKKKVIFEIVKRMEEHAEGGADYDGKVFLVQSECIEDAEAVADLVKAKFPKMNGVPEITSIGTVIGSHTGPGTVALFFWGDKRVD